MNRAFIALALATAVVVATDYTCQQCQQQGEGYYCQSNSQCYKYSAECDFVCPGHGNCVDTTTCPTTPAPSTPCMGGAGTDCTCNVCGYYGYNAFCKSNTECYRYKATECMILCPGSITDNNCIDTSQCGSTCTGGQGQNCTCSECGTAGYAGYCKSNGMCFKFDAQCRIICPGGQANCVPTAMCNSTKRH